MGKKNEKISLAQIQKIRIDCKIFEIKISSYSGAELEMRWSDSSTRTLKIAQTDTELNITDKAAITIYGPLELINLKKNAQLEIHVPERYDQMLIVQSQSNKICLSDLKIPGKIGLASDTGEILLENVEAGQIDIRGKNGKINCYAITAEREININSTLGNIVCCINDEEAAYTVFCETQRTRRNSVPAGGGTGDKKLRILSKQGQVSVSFQPGVFPAGMQGNRARGDKFQDW